MDSGVASRPIDDLDAYREKLQAFSNRSLMFMQPVIEVARRDQERLVYAEGENPTILRTVQGVVREGIARPIVIGRKKVVAKRLRKLGIDLTIGKDFELTDPEDDPRYRDYWQFYHELVARRGVSVAAAQTVIRTNTTAIAACMVARGDADAMICGTEGRFDHHLQHIIEVIGTKGKQSKISSLTVLILPSGPLFITDAYIEVDPSAEHITDKALASAQRIRDFGIKPKVALLSHSNFGSSRAPSALKMRDAGRLIRERAPGPGNRRRDACRRRTEREHQECTQYADSPGWQCQSPRDAFARRSQYRRGARSLAERCARHWSDPVGSCAVSAYRDAVVDGQEHLQYERDRRCRRLAAQ